MGKKASWSEISTNAATCTSKNGGRLVKGNSGEVAELDTTD